MKFGKILGYIFAKRHVKAIKNVDIPVTCSYTLNKKFKQRLVLILILFKMV